MDDLGGFSLARWLFQYFSIDSNRQGKEIKMTYELMIRFKDGFGPKEIVSVRVHCLRVDVNIK